MPNEYYAANCGAASSSLGNMRIAGTTALPMYKGRVLYYPLYRRNPLLRDDTGLGFTGVFSVGASVANAIGGFMSAVAGMAAKIFEVISSIVSFILDGIIAVVSSVLSAASGLVMSVMDALSLKEGGDMNLKEAVDMAGFLQAKYESFKGAGKGKEAGLERDLTEEEKLAFDRQTKTAAEKIQELAGGVISAVGGKTNFLILSGAAAAAMLMIGGR